MVYHDLCDWYFRNDLEMREKLRDRQLPQFQREILDVFRTL